MAIQQFEHGKMTLEQFEILLDTLGTNFDSWPKMKQAEARNLAQTLDGKRLFRGAQKLEMLMMALQSTPQSTSQSVPESSSESPLVNSAVTPCDTQKEAFLEKLADIPRRYQQNSAHLTVCNRMTLFVTQALAVNSDGSRLFSPQRLASQAAAFAAVLAVGILVGITPEETPTGSGEIDLSETWFVASSDFELGE